MTKTLLAAAVAALAIVTAGCGGNDETPSASPTDEWAEGFCTAITSWTDSLQSATEQVTDLSSLSRDGLEDAANDATTATDQLVDDLRALGAPETESGEAVRESVNKLATSLESNVSDIERAADEASGLTGLPSAIVSITKSLAAMSTDFSATLQALESADVKGELQDALERSPACADIAS